MTQFADPGAVLPFIRVLNLKRRPDRKRWIQDELEQAGFVEGTDYLVTTAVDGGELEQTAEIEKLFYGNDFGSRKAIIGCALSHYGLWKTLLDDPEHDFYLIMEDDCQLADGFCDQLNALTSTLAGYDLLYFGYSMRAGEPGARFKHNKSSVQQHLVRPLERDNYIGGAYCYSISKAGASKLCSHIERHGIGHGIDYLPKILPAVELFELVPRLAFSDWRTIDNEVDTDIQVSFDRFEFRLRPEDREAFEFLPGKDQQGFDLEYHPGLTAEDGMALAARSDDCVCFNTLGFFKSNLLELTPSPYFGPDDGLYVKKSFLHSSGRRFKPTIKLKLLGHWGTSEKLCEDWSVMCETGWRWKDLELTATDDDTAIDYYVMINAPGDSADNYDPARTFVFQMEPWVEDPGKNWGAKTWGEWAEPNENVFLRVFTPRKDLNNVQWQIRVPVVLPEPRERAGRVIAILGPKDFDEGHRNRIELVRALETHDRPLVDVFGRDNHHDLSSYVGPLDSDRKELHFPHYRYALAVENNWERNYATEKIWEPLLCECLPFYWGCPNLEDYIDPRVFVRLDRHDLEGARLIIMRAIKEDWWSQRIDAIKAVKARILDELGFFPRLRRVIDEL